MLLCALYMGLLYPWFVVIIPMYNAHPYFPSKTWGERCALYMTIPIFIFFFFLRFYLFIFRRGREGEREGEKHQYVLPVTNPSPGPGPQPRHVPQLGIKPATPWFTGQRSIHWATPARAHFIFWMLNLSLGWIPFGHDIYYPFT